MATATIAQQLDLVAATTSGWQDLATTGLVSPQLQTITTASPDYEKLRTKFFNDRLPDARPAEIATPTTTHEVSKLIANAKARGRKVGVRSGGHLFAACSLVDGALLIDTSSLNHNIEYNPVTKIAAFGPAIKVREAAETLTAIGRFFPFGHHPSVGLCGFLLAGGQGWFMRGWGCTSDSWVEQLEVVMPNGEVILASLHQNQDVFWAARGSGQGFFGVVTRIWGRTMPAKSLYDRMVVLDASNDYQKLLKGILRKCDATAKYGVDITVVTHYSDLFEPGNHWETKTKKLVMMVALAMYADSIEEANTMTSPWDSLEDPIARKAIMQVPTKPTTWEKLFKDQDIVFPSRDRWQCDSILTNKEVSYDEIATLSEKAMCDLPNRKCIGAICVADYYPNEADQALSLPQHHYISTMTRWENSAEDEQYSKWMLDAYKPLEKISAGQYIADFDVNQRMSKVMTDGALKKWLSVRQKWDPAEMFPGYRGFKSVLDQ